MSIRSDQRRRETRRTWLLALGVAALVMLILLGLFSINVGDNVGGAGAAVERPGARAESSETLSVLGAPPSRPVPPAAQTKTVGLRRIKAQVQGEADLVAAEALFFDPSPLFLPTPWNAGQARLPEVLLQEVEELFGDYAAKLSFSREGQVAGLPHTQNEAASAERSFDLVFADEEGGRLSVIGRRAEEPARLPARGGRIEVVSPQRAEPVIVADLGELGEGGPSVAENWRPLELAALVNEAGLVGGVQLVQSSGVEAVDEFFRDYVARELHLGERVGPGLYRILVGP